MFLRFTDICIYNMTQEHVFSSPGPKVQVNYWRPSSVNFSHFKLLLRNHWADWNQT